MAWSEVRSSGLLEGSSCGPQLLTGACKIGVDSVLTRVMEAIEGAVAYTSRIWSRRIEKSQPAEREVMSVLWPVEKIWYYYLLAGGEMNLITDCSALSSLFESVSLSFSCTGEPCGWWSRAWT